MSHIFIRFEKKNIAFGIIVIITLNEIIIWNFGSLFNVSFKIRAILRYFSYLRKNWHYYGEIQRTWKGRKLFKKHNVLWQQNNNSCPNERCLHLILIILHNSYKIILLSSEISWETYWPCVVLRTFILEVRRVFSVVSSVTSRHLLLLSFSCSHIACCLHSPGLSCN